jgi:hypothetical protein
MLILNQQAERATKSHEEIAELKANLFLASSLSEMYKHFDYGQTTWSYVVSHQKKRWQGARQRSLSKKFCLLLNRPQSMNQTFGRSRRLAKSIVLPKFTVKRSICQTNEEAKLEAET